MMHTKTKYLNRLIVLTINLGLLTIGLSLAFGTIKPRDKPKVRTQAIFFSEKALDKEVTTTTSLFELPVIQTTTTAKPKPKIVKPKIPSGKTSEKVVVTGDIWWRLALCESGGKNVNTGNGFYGYFQFVLKTWRSVGGTGYPHHHGYEEQKVRAQILQKKSGWGQWPGCSKKLGLR